jgi:hypothetical protein
MGCPSCGRGFHEECIIGCNDCHGKEDKLVRTLVHSGTMGAPLKNPEDIKDPYSTGRKRAAIQYPIFKTNPCEWRGKKNCGGGKETIIGCIDGFQRDAHHGPVKNPLRNEPGNVHRICKHCHNRWHELNDGIYDEATYNEMSHNPEIATELELLANVEYWKLRGKL